MSSVTRFNHEDHHRHDYRPDDHRGRDVATGSVSDLNEDAAHHANLVKGTSDTAIF